MTFTPGTKLGTYEIVRPLGAGGMGEVYGARDSKLKREVAIKVLPDTFARDPERIALFQREAEVLASLNHPHIAGIYDLAEFGTSRFLVLELVEGETLADRIARGPIPLEEALAIAKQIAEAVEAAHEKGIVHRDLKPANIKLTGDGNVKVLDFGLAKMRPVEAPNAGLSNSPTLMSASVPGVIVGTAAYMSPEQAKGKETDRASDVWAFGCVLYEMVTGSPTFTGETLSEVLAGVLKGGPDWTRLPAETPESIRRLLRRCLTKDRKLRLQHLGDARLEIEEPRNASVVQPVSRRAERFLWITALVAMTVIAAVLSLRAFRSQPIPEEMRLEINTPATSDPAALAISPDGQKIVFGAIVDGRSQLVLRSLDSVSTRPLAGTEGGLFPFWSPDSRFVGFFADSNLKRIDVTSGSVQTLATAPTGRGGAWNRDGTIIFAPTATGPLFRIRATGGEPSAVTRLNVPAQASHRYPQFLPDQRHFLYYATGSLDVRGIYVGQLDGSETQRLLDADTAAAYASSGQLLFVRQSSLFAQNFDPSRLTLSGDPFLVAQQVSQSGLGNPNLGALSTSASGPIVFRSGSSSGQRLFEWFDRSGKEIRKVGDLDSMYGPSLSPDGRRVAMSRTVNGNTDVWLLEFARGVLTRLTFDSGIDSYPIWSPDGKRIVFQTARNGTADLYQKTFDNAANEEPLLSNPQSKLPYDWSADGRFLIYRNIDAKTGWDLWVLPMAGDRKPFSFVQTNFEERDAQFSPDGKWIAYQSNESGRFEIYMQPFPGGGTKIQISTNGGAQVRWRPDGKELFYIALDDRLMAVPIHINSDGKAIDAGAPAPLFATHVGGAVQIIYRPQYMVSPDGQRFLMSTVSEEAASPITIMLNWRPERGK
jgi:eukaryotic-like serine/threonine-protein kinase